MHAEEAAPAMARMFLRRRRRASREHERAGGNANRSGRAEKLKLSTAGTMKTNSSVWGAFDSDEVQQVHHAERERADDDRSAKSSRRASGVRIRSIERAAARRRARARADTRSPSRTERRDERVEQTAQDAADRHAQVERGEVAAVGAPRQLAVADHGGKEKREQMIGASMATGRLVSNAMSQASGSTQRAACAASKRAHEHAPREDQHEGQQVDDERHDPEERHRGDVGREKRRHAKQQARRHERQRNPVKPLAPARASNAAPGVESAAGSDCERAMRTRLAGREVEAGGRQQHERDISARPDRALLGESQRRLEQRRIRDEREDAADVAGNGQEIRIARAWMIGAAKTSAAGGAR